jgi:hypothetical protein
VTPFAWVLFGASLGSVLGFCACALFAAGSYRNGYEDAMESFKARLIAAKRQAYIEAIDRERGRAA